jgi:hypothetical protein
LTSDQIRDILVSNGTPQKGNLAEHIGPRPDLAAAIAVLPTPPSIYVSPFFIDTSLYETDSAVEQVWIVNRSTTESFDFDIVANDSAAKTKVADWLTVFPTNGTLLSLDSIQIDVTLDATVLTGQVETYKGVLEVSWGISAGPKDSLTLVPVYLQVLCSDSSYDSLSSEDIGGPEFDWISAKDLGTKVPTASYYSEAPNPLDDGTTGPWPIGFEFPFYGSSFDSVYLSINGALSFTEVDINDNGYFTDISIPNIDFSNLISVFWNDLIIRTDIFAASGLYIYQSLTNDTMVIEWYKLGNFSGGLDTTTIFEVILTVDGNITLQYLGVGVNDINQTATIGISEFDCVSLGYFNSNVPLENIVSDSSAVRFTSNLWDYVLAGDIVQDGSTNILDLNFLVNYIFRSGPAADPFMLGDANCDGTGMQILDLNVLVNYIFRSGPETCKFILRY